MIFVVLNLNITIVGNLGYLCYWTDSTLLLHQKSCFGHFTYLARKKNFDVGFVSTRNLKIPVSKFLCLLFCFHHLLILLVTFD